MLLKMKRTVIDLLFIHYYLAKRIVGNAENSILLDIIINNIRYINFTNDISYDTIYEVNVQQAIARNPTNLTATKILAAS